MDNLATDLSQYAMGLIYFAHFCPSFTVNLRNSRTENIALHLNPRIKSGVFIRNSYLGEAWGYEERELPFFPFSPGEYFEVGIYIYIQQTLYPK